jgi:hypothetical protein
MITEKHFKDEIKRHEKTVAKLDDMKAVMEDMRETLEVTQETLDEMNGKFDRATDERAPRTLSTSKHESFVLIKLNKPNYAWKYYVIRCQTSVVRRTVKKLRGKYPLQTILLEIAYQPNSKNLFNLVRQDLELNGNISAKGNYLKLLNTYTEADLLQSIQDINDAKKDVTSEDETEPEDDESEEESEEEEEIIFKNLKIFFCEVVNTF